MLSERDIVLTKLTNLGDAVFNLLANGPSELSTDTVGIHFSRYEKIRNKLVSLYPDIFDEYHPLKPQVYPLLGHGERGEYFEREEVEKLMSEIDGMRKLAESLGFYDKPAAMGKSTSTTPKDGVIFVSHAHSHLWREVDEFLQHNLKLKTLVLKREAYEGRSNLTRLVEAADKCVFAVVVMTGDDHVGMDDAPRARENVIHESGTSRASTASTKWSSSTNEERACQATSTDTVVCSSRRGISRRLSSTSRTSFVPRS